MTPEYIINNWTDELLYLMTLKLSERKERQTGKAGSTDDPGGYKVPDSILFARAKNLIQVVQN